MLSLMLRDRFYRNVAAVCLTVAGVAIGLHAAGPDTRLADAAKQGNLKAVQTLLIEKADVNATAADGTTALHWAAYRDDAAMANALIKAGANLRAATRVGGITPLLLAAGNGNARAVEALLSA